MEEQTYTYKVVFENKQVFYKIFLNGLEIHKERISIGRFSLFRWWYYAFTFKSEEFIRRDLMIEAHKAGSESVRDLIKYTD